MGVGVGVFLEGDEVEDVDRREKGGMEEVQDSRGKAATSRRENQSTRTASARDCSIGDWLETRL